MNKVLEVKNITKSFGNIDVLKGVSFSIDQGEIFGFLGRNGAGKSTLINILTGVIHQTNGGFQILGGSLDKVKHKIGVFPDVDNFYADWSANQHLKFFAKVQKLKIQQKEIDERLALVGLLKDKEKKVKNFSFGMKKKLGVAQALINNPEFIILDEPTSGLDAESAIHMRELVNKLAAQGKTIFITSHNLNELEILSDRIAILKDGQISVIGTMEELRVQAQNKIQVEITLNRPLRKEDLATIDLPPHQINKQNLRISVKQQEEIGNCIRQLVLKGYNIYSVIQQEKTLEDIFLQNEVAH